MSATNNTDKRKHVGHSLDHFFEFEFLAPLQALDKELSFAGLGTARAKTFQGVGGEDFCAFDLFSLITRTTNTYA